MTLLAPEGPGRVLLDSGPPAITALLGFDSATFSPLHQQAPLTDSLRRRLSAFGAALVFTRSSLLLRHLAEPVPRIVQRDPTPPHGTGHASRWFAGAVRELGIPDPETPLPRLEMRAHEAEEMAHQLPERFLTIHPASGSPSKNWPAERFAALADALAPGAPFALIEGPADAEACRRVRARAPRAFVVRDQPARVVGALVSLAGLYVGNDSGISHLAAAVGAPTLALFGPTDPDVWGPVGSRSRTLRAPGGDLGRLEMKTVLDYVSGAWTSSRLMSR